MSASPLGQCARHPPLDRGDVDGFRKRALRVAELERDWAAVVLAEPTGSVLMDTRAGADEPQPAIADRDSFDRVVRTRKAVIGNLVRGADDAWQYAVRPAADAKAIRIGVLLDAAASIVAGDPDRLQQAVSAVSEQSPPPGAPAG